MLTEDGLIVTNAHVVSSAGRGAQLTVTLYDGRKLPAEVHSFDKESDVALVKLKGAFSERFRAAKIGSSGRLRPGEWAVAVGSPLRLQNSVTAGIVSSTARHGSEIGSATKLHEYIQTDAAINQGNSGGPLVNLDGEVIGINVAKLGGQLVTGISFAIPIDTAMQIVEQLRSKGRVQRPYIGMRFVQHRDGSLSVVDITDGSPAERCGLKIDDTILEFDEKPVKS